MIIVILCWGVYSTTGKTAMQTLSPEEATAGSIFIGWAIFGIGMIPESGLILPVLLRIDFWWNVFFLGAFTTFIGFLFFFIGINKLGASKTAGFINFVPVFGTTLSFLILAETIYWTFLIGLILVIIGVSIINYPKNEDSVQEDNPSLEA